MSVVLCPSLHAIFQSLSEIIVLISIIKTALVKRVTWPALHHDTMHVGRVCQLEAA